MRFISVGEVVLVDNIKRDINSPTAENSNRKYLYAQYFNLSTHLEELLLAAQKSSMDDFITGLVKLYRHYLAWKKEQTEDDCQIDDFAAKLVNHYMEPPPSNEEEPKESFITQLKNVLAAKLVNDMEPPPSNEEEPKESLIEKLKNLRARIIVSWSTDEEVLSQSAMQMLQKIPLILSKLNDEYLNSYFVFQPDEKEKEELHAKLKEKFKKRLRGMKEVSKEKFLDEKIEEELQKQFKQQLLGVSEVFEKIFLRMLPIMSANRVRQRYLLEHVAEEGKKGQYYSEVDEYNIVQLIEATAKTVARLTKVKLQEQTDDIRQQLFKRALMAYIRSNATAIRNNLNEITKSVISFNQQERTQEECMTSLMNNLSQLMGFIKAFHKDLSKESALTTEEIKDFFEGLSVYFNEEKQEGRQQEAGVCYTQVGFACPQIEDQMRALAGMLKRMTAEPNIKSIFQCKEEKSLTFCKEALRQLADCCEHFAIIPRFPVKGKGKTNEGFAEFIRCREKRELPFAIAKSNAFKPYYEEEKYHQGLKESYLQLVSGLSAFYQLQFGGLLARLRYGMTPEQKALKVLIAKILQHMTGESSSDKEMQLSTIPNVRVQDAIDEYNSGNITIGGLSLEFNPTLFAKEVMPIFNSFKKDLVLRDAEKFNSEELKKSLQFRIARKVLTELKETGVSKLARREKTEGILASLGQFWNSFLALFAIEPKIQRTEPRIVPTIKI